MFVMCSPCLTSAHHIQIVKTSAQQRVHRKRKFFQSLKQAVGRKKFELPQMESSPYDLLVTSPDAAKVEHF